jgi:PilZ domain
MASLPKPGQPPRSERRQYRRFDLQYPIRLRFQLANSPGEIEAISRNVGVGGLLLETAVAIPQHTPVGFVMTIQGGRVVRPIHLVGDGEVARVEPGPSGKAFVIAIRCTEPISELESSLLASAR